MKKMPRQSVATSRSIAAGLTAALMLCACGPQAAPPPAPQAATAGIANPASWPKSASHGLKNAETEAFVGELMAKMSLEEKVGQMIQGDISSVRPEDLRKYPLGSILAGGNSPPLGAPDRAPAGPWIETARAYRTISLEEREGHVPIPVMFGIDAVHGNNNVIGAVIYPHNIALGAANDPALMRRIGAATAAETAAVGIDWAFGPTLAVPQNDGWGRAYEGYSENPDLVRSYASEMVLGLQGEAGAQLPLQSGHVASSPKHFLGDGGTHAGMDQGDNRSSEADLIRIHAAGYPAAIEAGAMTVMASFSSWQGVKMHGNRSLLTDVLKGRMGFDGFVVGDWNGHGQIPGCSNESCAATFNAGVDMAMAPDSWKGLYENTLAQARSGEIPMARIDDAVRRILRVKYRLGLFDQARPWEGKAGVIGAPEHRALAREVVRKSLVLLKNNGGVLPIKASAKVLVAGSGADDVGQQSGGWSLSWQGTGNQRADFPNAQTIFEGLREALQSSGGLAELSVDGKFKQRPDVAIVVYGETPYAELVGDIQTLEFQPGEKQDLALLKKLKAQGIPVVSVFLSGRPLWVNPELNASDAFVAAWLPGTEGGGIADVLVAGADGKPRHDFHGKLSFSWPRTAAQLELNKGQANYDPLFPLGYGLTYASTTTVPMLAEVSGVSAATTNAGNYYRNGRSLPPWQLALRHDAKTTLATGNSADSDGGALSLRATDANGIQEGGRRLRWSGSSEASVAVVSNAAEKSVNLERQANADMVLQLQYRVDSAPEGPVSLAMDCGAGCRGAVDVTSIFNAPPAGQWRTVKFRLDCFRKAGAKLANVVEPFVLSTAAAFELSIAEVRLVADPAGAVCPGQ
ncbi:exo 1,3/1,4-beta-D-glucan glucohydrolase [Lysobacter sp. CFH 32150]|uniref:glycoside hydrolase family 3 protein n=1 Tax=Lysobacter sp. CFH 32150 TaxID=2927128 RepID=UPI001FA7DFD9|nr:exo 1,3/1,4-beta-D-glucan glucohydrolase [Lysobacter sp. CFH 32150]MCI4566365.1 exo 1,3/1,4-beta-D-glucan glucohydrolase [Lysobacter sp. CFH 32150]